MGFYLINSFFFKYYIQWCEISRHVFSIYKNWNSLIFSMCVCVCVRVCVCVCVCVVYYLLYRLLTGQSFVVAATSFEEISCLTVVPAFCWTVRLEKPQGWFLGNRSSHTVSVIPLSLFLIQMLVYQIPVRPRIRPQWRAEILPGHEEQSAISNTLLFKVFLNKTTEWLFLSHKKILLAKENWL